MAKISLELIQQLREITGLGMMDCKKALIETDGDIERAVVLLRKKGLAVAQKRAEKSTSQGLISAYIHPGSTLGVLLEIDCETDFVASTEDVKTFAKNICMQIAAMKPLAINPENLDLEYLNKEKDIIKAQLKESGKPEAMIEKIAEGKLTKIYSEVCLVKQPYLKDDKRSVEDILNDLIAKLGEKIVIKRFARFQVGVHGEDFFTI
ncbi:TPA: elongation factor Ts [Candidatus Dependentiae bacterium]|nr:MAG: Elongation factor Ts [candidate division TM6 bacterium GW2011_GWF2_36_131]KKQ02639.1 MAG: Elongation factor Ts [candidate division TM6 bacterium GW2011_GWE2_36_25]KKQ19227.1 MAG: Elongation factor Ts [candidate division TM6 bacterium GW2011_GWA2_36_9]HBR70271.1 elongation factor Ts [Candidatus Dependentiae bacterium]HCU00957.1 elongation factor Ts [Candidatus Dependentiae bacterium]